MADANFELDPRHLTVGDLLDLWYRHVQPELEATTAETYRHELGYVPDRLRDLPLRRLTTEHLEELWPTIAFVLVGIVACWRDRATGRLPDWLTVGGFGAVVAGWRSRVVMTAETKALSSSRRRAGRCDDGCMRPLRRVSSPHLVDWKRDRLGHRRGLPSEPPRPPGEQHPAGDEYQHGTAGGRVGGRAP